MIRLHGICAIWRASALLLLLAPHPAGAAGIELLAPFGNFDLREPQDPPPPGAPQFYSSTGPAAGWGISQWNVPGGKLPPFTSERVGDTEVFSSRAAEVAVQVRRSADHVAVRLSQDGRALPCTWQNGHPRESDLFIAPKASRGNAGPTGLLAAGRDLSLSRMASLTISAVVLARVSVPTSPKGCEVNQGAAIIAIVLRNTTVQPGQTLFYQLALNRICVPGPAEHRRRCGAGPTTFAYFWKKPPFGVDDFVSLLGVAPLVSGEQRHLAIDILPRLKTIIAAGPPGLDHDPSHWSFNGTYAGQHIWGDVMLETEWETYRLTANLR
jgi:hypothetical protein